MKAEEKILQMYFLRRENTFSSQWTVTKVLSSFVFFFSDQLIQFLKLCDLYILENLAVFINDATLIKKLPALL